MSRPALGWTLGHRGIRPAGHHQTWQPWGAILSLGALFPVREVLGSTLVGGAYSSEPLVLSAAALQEYQVPRAIRQEHVSGIWHFLMGHNCHSYDFWVFPPK